MLYICYNVSDSHPSTNIEDDSIKASKRLDGEYRSNSSI